MSWLVLCPQISGFGHLFLTADVGGDETVELTVNLEGLLGVAVVRVAAGAAVLLLEVLDRVAAVLGAGAHGRSHTAGVNGPGAGGLAAVPVAGGPTHA